MTIAENIQRIRETMAQAAEKAGRGSEKILLVAASKTNPADRVREAVLAGVDACGENRVQELVQKRSLSAYEGAALHFIGHLQSNKVKQVVGVADLIESCDSASLLRLISDRARQLKIIQDVLIEVNIGEEEQKSGISPESLDEILSEASEMGGVKVRGLMAVPPVGGSPAESTPYFERMYKLYVDITGKKYNNISMDFLSMGMSADFPLAIICGANMIRVGSAIFGARNYNI